MSKLQVFVCFDIEHDGELYERLVAQSETSSAGFAVSGGSERPTFANIGTEAVRCRIRDADQVIVICGEHTQASTRMSDELRIAQEERTPYFLLWGRRDSMCTKPTGAKPTEGMYSWTPQVLESQITLTLRKARADATAEATAEATRKS